MFGLALKYDSSITDPKPNSLLDVTSLYNAGILVSLIVISLLVNNPDSGIFKLDFLFIIVLLSIKI